MTHRQALVGTFRYWCIGVAVAVAIGGLVILWTVLAFHRVSTGIWIGVGGWIGFAAVAFLLSSTVEYWNLREGLRRPGGSPKVDASSEGAE